MAFVAGEDCTGIASARTSVVQRSDVMETGESIGIREDMLRLFGRALSRHDAGERGLRLRLRRHGAEVSQGARWNASASVREASIAMLLGNGLFSGRVTILTAGIRSVK